MHLLDEPSLVSGDTVAAVGVLCGLAVECDVFNDVGLHACDSASSGSPL